MIDSDVEKVLAFTLDEKYIVGAILDGSDIPERHVWDSISEVFRIMPEYNLENHKQVNELKKDISNILEKLNGKNTVSKILDSSQQGIKKVETM